MSGRLKEGEQIPSEHEMSATFGVSRHTVRKAIGDMVNEGWLYRVQGKGTYVRTIRANEGGIRTIGVITTYISDYIFPAIIRGAEKTLREKGYRLLLSSTDNDKRKERQSLEMMMGTPLNGLIVEPTKSAAGNPNLDHYLSLNYRQIPYVMINARYPELRCPCVKVDDEQGGFTAAEHLLQLGHRRIAGFFKTDDLQGVGRMKGFMEAHLNRRIPLHPDNVVTYSTEDKHTKPAAAAAAMLRRDNGRPTAFVCYNDELAIVLLDVIRQSGMKVPDDISVVGFDDSSLAVASEVKLTTLIHPKMELGVRAAKWLIDLIENKAEDDNEDIVFTTRLIVRNSTKPI